jgi:hypothetical protein
MYGFKLRYVKKSVLLLAALIALILAWSDLSRAFFIIFTACAAVAGLIGWLARNAWTQTSEGNYRPAQVATRPRRERKTRAQARARRAEELHPEETVTLSEEREAADIDDVFAALDNQLVGLVPVKSKVEEIASLLLVDRVRNRFGLEAPRPNLHMCFTGDPGTGKTTVALQMADLLSRLGYLEKGHLVTLCATTSSVNSSGKPRRKPGVFSNGPWAESFSSTRLITCTGAMIQGITVRNASTSCSR